jgi:diacylglycerol kinase family enzyme
VPKDGLLDVCIVKNVSRRVFISLLPKYSKGTFLEDKKAKDIIVYKKCKSVVINNAKDMWNLCVDGEVKKTGAVKLEIVPDAIRFSLPRVLSSN